MPLEFRQEFQGCTLRAEASLETFTLPPECTFKVTQMCRGPHVEPWTTYTLERIA